MSEGKAQVFRCGHFLRDRWWSLCGIENLPDCTTLMSRTSLTISGLVFLVAAISTVILAGILKLGASDVELAYIRHEGRPANIERFSWSEWRPNNGDARPVPTERSNRLPETLPEYRVGIARGWIFTFTTAEVRYPNGGVMYKVPAIGPGWGASIRWFWPSIVAVTGVLLLVISCFAPRNNATKTSLGKPA